LKTATEGVKAQMLHVGSQFMDAALMCRKMDRRIANAVGMTVDEVHCLYALATSSPSCVKVLSDVLGLSPPRTSKVLRSLEQRGYVVRTLHAEDRRMEQILLTPAGTDAAEHIVRLSNETGYRLYRKEEGNEGSPPSDADVSLFSD
jgi:DNA-binding MarR family transcriptional regulator